MALFSETNITSTGKLPSSFTGAQLGTADLLEQLLGKERSGTTSPASIASGFDQDFLARTIQNLLAAQQPARDISRQRVTDATRRAGMLSSGLAGTVAADLEGQFALQDRALGSQLGGTFFQEQLKAQIADAREAGEGSPEFQQLNELLRSSNVFKESQSQQQSPNTLNEVLSLLAGPLSDLISGGAGGLFGTGSSGGGLLGSIAKGAGSLIDSIFGGGGGDGGDIFGDFADGASFNAFQDFDFGNFDFTGDFGTSGGFDTGSFADLEDAQARRRATGLFPFHARYTVEDWRWLLDSADFDLVAEAGPLHERYWFFVACPR